MLVTVKFIGAFRSISGKSKLSIKIEDMISLKEFIRRLVEEQPKLKKALIDPELEDPRPNTLILVNGKEISVLNGLDTMLNDEAEVVFVPVVHGG
jgi:MoaD family protein